MGKKRGNSSLHFKSHFVQSQIAVFKKYTRLHQSLHVTACKFLYFSPNPYFSPYFVFFPLFALKLYSIKKVYFFWTWKGQKHLVISLSLSF